MALDPYFAQVLGRSSQALPAPEDDPSLLGTLGGGFMSGLGWLGETLDKPGRAVRGLLSGRPGELLNLLPFSDTIGITDPTAQTSGRDLLEQIGILDANQEGLDTGDVAGFGAEIALDPLTYLTFGASALGKSGRIGKAAGVTAKDIAKAASKKLGRTVGKSEARMLTNLGDVLKYSDDAEGLSSRLARAAEKSGTTLDEISTDALGGLFGAGKPFGGPSWLAQGATAQKAAQKLDKLGNVLRYGKVPGTQVSPGQQLARLFSPRAGGLSTPELAPIADDLFDAKKAIQQNVRSDVASKATKLFNKGQLDDESAMLGRMYFEGVDLQHLSPEELAKAESVGKVMQDYYVPSGTGNSLPELQQAVEAVGGDVGKLADPAGVQYVPRQFVDYLSNSVLSMPREERLVGWRKGTEAIRKAISDPDIVNAKTIDDAVAVFEKKYGDQFVGPLGDAASFSKIPDPSTTTKSLYDKALKMAQAATEESPLAAREAQRAAQIQQMAGEIGPLKFKGPPSPEEFAKIGRQPLARPSYSGNVERIGRQPLAGAGWTTPTPEFGRSQYAAGQVVKGATDRDNLIREFVDNIRTKYTPEQRAAGGFGRHVLEDTQDAVIGLKLKKAKIDHTLDAVAASLKPRGQHNEFSISLGDILGDLGLQEVTTVTKNSLGNIPRRAGAERGGALVEIAKRLGMGTTPAELEALKGMSVPGRLVDDAIRLMKGPEVSRVVGPLMKAFDSATNLFKIGVLSWPARYVRDFVSGQVQSMLTGNWSAKAFNQANKIVRGGVVDLTGNPVIRQMLDEKGLKHTAENSTDMVRELVYSTGLIDAFQGRGGLGMLSGDVGAGVAGRADDFSKQFIGRDPMTAKNVGKAFKEGTWNPLDVAGVTEFKSGNPKIASDFKVAKVSDRLGKYTDSLNRLTPFLHNLEKGADPGYIKKMVDAMQVDYHPSNFTATEHRYLKRLFPFYSYTSRMVPFVAGELAKHPGGGLAQAIRASNSLSGTQGDVLPDYVRQGLTVPLGKGPKGDDRYLAGLGLMHEDPAQFLGGLDRGPLNAARSMMLEGISRTSPFIKGPLETAFGRSAFMKDSEGGRPIEDLDPSLGRILANVKDMATGSKTYRVDPVGGQLTEQALSNSPLARLLTSTRTLTDPRKTGWEKAMNLLSGAKVTTVSDRAKDRELEDRVNSLMKSLGAKTVERVYLPKDVKEKLANLPEDERIKAERLLKLQTLLAKRARQRNKEKAK